METNHSDNSLLELALHRLREDRTLKHASRRFDDIARGATDVVICGAGALGRQVLANAPSAGLRVVGFADNKGALWGCKIADIPVYSPAEAIARHGQDALFIVAIYNSSAVRQQLEMLGCTRIVSYPVFCWRFLSIVSHSPIDVPERILSAAHDIHRGYSCLDDERSRREFVSQIAWRCTLDDSTLAPADPAAEMYFPSDLVTLSDDEIFVDCGAFNGDTLRLFVAKTGGVFRHVYACEPDPINRGALEDYVRHFSDDDLRRVDVLPFAVGDRNATLSFDMSGTAGSRFGDKRDSTVECRRLDDLLSGVRPTFIKMDIEGAEPQALRGSVATMVAARPVMAVCAYHQCDHLWTLPIIMKAALPEYQISLRRYAEECWETVYYAIPPERSQSVQGA